MESGIRCHRSQALHHPVFKPGNSLRNPGSAGGTHNGSTVTVVEPVPSLFQGEGVVCAAFRRLTVFDGAFEDCMDAGGTSPWTGEGRTMQEQLSRATPGAVAEALTE